MRPFRPGRWGSSILPLATPRQPCPHCHLRLARHNNTRLLSTSINHPETAQPLKRPRGRPRKNPVIPLQSNVAATAPREADEPVPKQEPETDLRFEEEEEDEDYNENNPASNVYIQRLEDLPSPHPSAARSSPKLSALHSRLSLSSRIPLETLARTLVHRTADRDRRFNNSSLKLLGKSILHNHAVEHLVCTYPRLPMVIMTAAKNGYIGDAALSSLVQEWGVEAAAEPGGEVDPGFLQFKHAPPGWLQHQEDPYRKLRDSKIEYTMKDVNWRRDSGQGANVVTLDQARASFARALFGAIYLHSGAAATQDLFKSHIMTRKLDVSTLFTFTSPARDLSKLCAREKFEPPVARMLSESGRNTRHPVYIVGIYSGLDKLGEGAGASMNEARFKAAIAALKGWYLYSPSSAGKITLPSQAEAERRAGRDFKPNQVDIGEVLV